MKRNQKGFTLVELMIVVAIIGILAAIAIPQFAAYRIRGFNSSALSDLRNVNTGEAAMFADQQTFGTSLGATARPAAGAQTVWTGALGGPGALITGPNIVPANLNSIEATIPSGTAAGPINVGVVVGLSNGVSLQAATEVMVPAVNPRAASTIVSSKHLNGNTYYAADSDQELIYQDMVDGSNGTAMVLNDCAASAASTQGFDDINGTNNAAVNGGPWVVK